MSATKPEHIDRHGLRHRHGCLALNVSRRPSFTRAHHDYVRCLDCGSVALLPTLEIAQTNNGRTT